MPVYEPNNQAVFVAAGAGAISGLVGNRSPSDTNQSNVDVSIFGAYAYLWAQAFDTQWGSAGADTFEITAISEASEAFFSGRFPYENVTVTEMLTPAAGIVAIIRSGDAYFSGGAVPPAPGTWLTQAAWFVDPANSTGVASNLNDGLTAVTPILDEGELYRRRMIASAAYGYQNDGYFPILQNTLVTYLSPPPTPSANPIYLVAEQVGAFNLSYTCAPTVIRSGTIATVQPRDGGNGPATGLTLLTSPFVVGNIGLQVWNVTRGTLCTILAVSEGVADITEPIALLTSPSTKILPSPAQTQTLSQVGDAITLLKPFPVQLAGVPNLRSRQAAGGTLGSAAISFLNFEIQSVGGGFTCSGDTSSTANLSRGVNFSQCVIDGPSKFAGCCIASVNTWWKSPTYVFNALGAYESGCLNSGYFGNGISYFDGWILIGSATAPVTYMLNDIPGNGPSVFHFGQVNAYNGTVLLTLNLAGSNVYLAPVLYGPGTEAINGTVTTAISLYNGAYIQKGSARTWAAYFAGTFGGAPILLEGQPNAVNFNTTTLVLGAVISACTPANLDNPAVLNSYAVYPGTGSSVHT